jgi:DNA-3-methyladenine glycosylase II
MQSYRTTADLEAAINHLIACEPRFGTVHKTHGTPSLRASEGGIKALLMIVTEQFLSLKAAAAIWARVEAALETLTPSNLLTQDAETLLALGLSRAKVKTFHAVAKAVDDRALDFETLHQAPDAAVHATLCALPGIGPWTADIYLLSVLGRADAWPAGDLALQLAAQHLLALSERPSRKQMAVIAEAWRPHRAAAARLLWSHYRSLKGLKQV